MSSFFAGVWAHEGVYMLVKCVLGWVNAPPALFSLAVHPDLTVFVCIYVRLRTDSGLSNVCRLLVIPVSLFPAMTESLSVFLEVSHSYQHIYSLRGIKQPLCVCIHTHTHTHTHTDTERCSVCDLTWNVECFRLFKSQMLCWKRRSEVIRQMPRRLFGFSTLFFILTLFFSLSFIYRSAFGPEQVGAQWQRYCEGTDSRWVTSFTHFKDFATSAIYAVSHTIFKACR